MLTCRAASERLSRSLDAPLPMLETFALGAHLIVCPACRRFRMQFLAIHELSRSAMALSDNPTGDMPLSEEVKQRIKLEMGKQE